MSEAIDVQWFPGHMAKTRRIMKSSMPLVDAVVEITDARIPYSSRNPEIDKIIGKKPRLVLLNKCDAADETVTSRWIDYYKRNGVYALATDCKSGRGLNKFLPTLKEILKDEIECWNKKGMTGRPLRIMIVGIPNVGKSSLINRLSKSKRAKVEDRPGATRGKQWVTLSDGVELLDMPGVLWPKFEDKQVGENLAFTGAVKDNIMDIEYLACRFLQLLNNGYEDRLVNRYGVDLNGVQADDSVLSDCTEGYEILQRIGKKRGFLISGGEIDTERTAIMVMDEFRGGKLGRLSLESPKVK
ncbi:MAG: ribosome biogenesis GTPase YlqF [Ruminococcus sp.]|nr:ribosome biogenesis GTPase YlqF [Ruminococcus sp.]